jgi:flagella basal body P-ring formation protein FlgA
MIPVALSVVRSVGLCAAPPAAVAAAAALAISLASPSPVTAAAPPPPSAPRRTAVNPAAAAAVTVAATAEVNGREIRLRDVSDAQGPLGDLVLAAAALPGRACTLSAGEIRLRLRASRVDLKRVTVPPVVMVTTRAAAAAAAATTPSGGGGRPDAGGLIAVAESAARKALSAWPAADVALEPVSVPVLPPVWGGVAAPVFTAGTPVPRSFRTITVPVALSAGGAPARTLNVAFRVRTWATVVVAARPIARHAALGAADVTTARIELTNGDPAARETDPAKLIGRRAVKPLLAGRPVAATDVEEAPVVAAYAPVAVRLAYDGVEVTTTGTTREEGRPAQVIRVRLGARGAAAGREVRARVIDAATVAIEE